MKKKGVSFRAMTAIAVLIFGVFMAVPAFGQDVYPADTALYPALYGAFLELYPNARYINIDFHNNSFTLTGITGRAVVVPISYDITVRLNAGRLEFSYDKIYQKDVRSIRVPRWTVIRSFGAYNYNNAVNDIRAKILEIANNPELFERNQRAAMADVFFIHAIIKDMTELASRDFIDNFARGSVYNITGRITDVTEYNREINGVIYRYLVKISINREPEFNDVYIMERTVIECLLYTNQDNVIRLNRSADTTVQGTITSAVGRRVSSSISLVEPR